LRKVFKSDTLNAQFHELGFVRSPLLNEQEIGELRSYFDAKHEESGDHGFFTTIWLENKTLRNEVNDYITSVLYDKVAELLVDYTPVFANYMVKKPGKKSVTQYHQDWTFVDESKFRSVNVWIPLVQLTEENGPLELVPYSVHQGDPFRGRNIPSPFRNAFKWIARSHGVKMYPDPGEAVIFDTAIIHGSNPTISSDIRVATSMVMKPAEATLLHYSCDNGLTDKIYERHVADSFFTDYGIFNDIAGLGYTSSQKRLNKKRSYIHFLINDYKIKRRYKNAGV